jgi:hypothetical protein
LGGGHLALHNMMGPLPGHRTCYYSDSGAQHMAGHGPYDAAAAGGAGVSAVALQQRTIKCSICGVSVHAVPVVCQHDIVPAYLFLHI